eukprot:Seg6118.2 transcript_id=Seg6118.2/GoldUCD/mRNA.D3Y31 product="hypothetical protein" protein_id=Seg6118.2/GoldUCD/D3Y31
MEEIRFMIVTLCSIFVIVQYVIVQHLNLLKTQPKYLRWESSRLQNRQSWSEAPEFTFLFNWRRILAHCQNDTVWLDEPARTKRRALRTSANRTEIVFQVLNSYGEYSIIVIQTYTASGQKKNIGGDSWRATLRGTLSKLVFVFDKLDGTYELRFRIFEPGNYSVDLVLEHSICDGLRDPPFGWFAKGNVHGHFQEQGLLGFDDSHLLQRFRLINFEFPATNSVHLSKLGHKRQNQETSKSSCRFVSSGMGAWKNINGKLKWLQDVKQSWLTGPKKVPFEEESPLRETAHSEETAQLLEKAPLTAKSEPPTVKKYDALWLLGDSLARRWFGSQSRKDLCKKLFKICKSTVSYTYLLEKIDHKKNNIGKNFNFTRFFEPIKAVFDSELMLNKSVVVVNFGLHLVMSLNFSQCQQVVDNFADMITTLRNERGPNNLPHIIWKTSTFTELENGLFHDSTHSRFLTNHRVQLLNAYSNRKLCSIGIPIFDVFPITASYPKGSLDGLHYDQTLFKPIEDELEHYLRSKLE